MYLPVSNYPCHSISTSSKYHGIKTTSKFDTQSLTIKLHFELPCHLSPVNRSISQTLFPNLCSGPVHLTGNLCKSHRPNKRLYLGHTLSASTGKDPTSSLIFALRLDCNSVSSHVQGHWALLPYC